jgi:hypothetical protein
MSDNKDVTDVLKEKLNWALDWYKSNTTFANRSIAIAVCLILLNKFVPFKAQDAAPSQMAINPQVVAGSVVDPLETSQGRLQYTQKQEEDAAAQYKATLLSNVEDYLSYRGNQFQQHIENIRRDNNLADGKQAAQLAQKEQADRLAKLRSACENKKDTAKRNCQSKADAEIGAALTELLALQLVIDGSLNLGDISYKKQTEITFDPSNLVTDNDRFRDATANRVAANSSYQDALVARTSNER